MRSSIISAAILAFASVVCAQTENFDAITSPYQDQNVPAGEPFEIVWEASKNYTGTVTIQLLEGATPSTLSKGDVIKAGVDNSLGKYTWDVPKTLGNFATYGFIITLDSDTSIFQYSFPFHVTGLSTNGAVSSSSVSASSTSTVTMHVGTGTAYTVSSSSTAVANSTSSSFSAPSSSTAKPTSNITLSTTIATKTSTPTGGSQSGASTTESAAPTATTNAAVAQVATGSLAMIGGLVLAFAL